jgi:hypothetical protein
LTGAMPVYNCTPPATSCSELLLATAIILS